MDFLPFAASLLAITGGGANIVLLFSALGGLSGIAAVLTVFVNYIANKRKAEVDDKSVAIIELEKAVPGMGDIIREWQNVVHHLQDDLLATRQELAECRRELEGHD